MTTNLNRIKAKPLIGQDQPKIGPKPPGTLDNQNNVQDAPGSLLGQGTAKKAGNGREIPKGTQEQPPITFEYIDPNEIKPPTVISHFYTPSDLKHPRVFRVDNGWFCYGGFSLVQKAKKNGDNLIYCRVDHDIEPTERNLLILPISLRTCSSARRISYAEKIWSYVILGRKLMALDDTLFLPRHGGARDKTSNASKTDTSITQVIVEGLDEDRDSVNRCLNYGKHLNDATLNKLAQLKIKKSAFEKIQRRKMKVMRTLEEEGKNPSEITEEVSKQVFDWITKLDSPQKANSGFQNSAPAEDTNGSNNVVVPKDTPDSENKGNVNEENREYKPDNKDETAAPSLEKPDLTSVQLSLRELSQKVDELAAEGDVQKIKSDWDVLSKEWTKISVAIAQL